MDNYNDNNFNNENFDGYEGVMDSSTSGKKKNKKNKKHTGKKAEGRLIVGAIAIIAAFVVFMVMTVLEDRIVNSVYTVPVVVAIAEVPVGVELTEENMAKYFAVEERDAEQIPDGITYSNGIGMVGKIVGRQIHVKEIVTYDCFVQETVFDDVEDGVELSLELGSLGQTVSGILRAGDLVDIKAVVNLSTYAMQKAEAESDAMEGKEEYPAAMEGMAPIEPVESEVTEVVGEGVLGENTELQNVEVAIENTEVEKEVIVLDEEDVLQQEALDLVYGVTGEYVAQTIAENVRVTGVFNSGGENTDAVESAGTTMVATVINITVPSHLVDAILIAQEEGTITLVKVDEEAQLERKEMEAMAQEEMVSKEQIQELAEESVIVN